MPPLKIAVVGGGPSAFYVASRLVQLLPLTHPRAGDLRIHIYDRLWPPYGLVRYGVAPDHPEVKNCTHKFDNTAADPRVRFFGNVNIGSSSPIPHAVPLPLQALLPYYTHLLLAPGSPVPRTLPNLPLARPAISLVHWYTRHPLVLTSCPIPPGTQHLTLLGLGNVSLDIARLILTPPAVLSTLDIPAHVLDGLRSTWETLRHIAIVGRRGPREARWTSKELRELLSLTHARMDPIDPRVLDAEGTMKRQETRMLQVLRTGSTAAPLGAQKSFSLNFWRTPVAQREGTLALEDTRTREQSSLSTDVVFASLGFRGDATPWDAEGWFDEEAGHVRHRGSRVLTPAGEVVRNVYVSGWAAHGARGVIAGTLLDARDVASQIVGDHYDKAVGDNLKEESGNKVEETEVELLPREVDMESVPEVVRKGIEAKAVTGFDEWKIVDEEERRRGEESGKERERMWWDDARTFLQSRENP